ncbi:BglG family transcription antiterminator [Calorimonas adulescens]|uniref:Transcription antiterminator n=1 Tax=Calorimonas adulescens TaxID=2606906 RepID=A0A5D8QBJ0_9THEO|nr:BglG family transcription antiterminator [Calorimonas adulescens]TZE81519.1 transcription antiterminator [Calorimonas adulescens]
MTNRLPSIVKILLNSRVPVTVDFIAKELGVSNKTIRNDLKTLEDYLQKRGLSLKKRPGIGVSIEGSEKGKAALNNEVTAGAALPKSHTPESRKLFILKCLLLSKGSITIKQLSELMYVSKVTIQKDLNDVEEWLQRFNLSLLKKTNYGIEVVGDEENVRNAMANLIAMTENEDNLKELLYNEATFRIDYRTIEKLRELIDLDYVSIEKIITHAEEKLGFRFSDEAYSSLLIHLAIAIDRVRKNKDIQLSNDVLNDLKQKRDYPVAREIASMTERAFNIKLPESEVGYILLHILGAKMQQGKSLEVDLSFYDERNEDIAMTMAKEIIEIAQRSLAMDFSSDKLLLNGLILHLQPTINRLKYGLSLRNPILNEIKSNYPEIFGVAWMTSVVFEKYLGKNIGEEEIGYIALHIGAAVERAKKPLRTLVVCTSGIGTSQLLAARLEKSFKQLEIVDVISSIALTERPLDDIDIVISTVPVECSKPVITINPILSSIDIKMLENFIETMCKKNYSHLRHTLPVEVLECQRSYRNKEEVITSMYNSLYASGYVKKGYLEAMLQREKIGPTTIGNGVAMPHGSPELVNKSILAVTTLQDPVSWEDDKVDVVFMVCIAKDDVDKARTIFKGLYEIIDSSQTLNLLRKAKNRDEIIRILEDGNNAY